MLEEYKRVALPQWESNLRRLCEEFMRKAMMKGFNPQQDPMLRHISSVGATREGKDNLSTGDKIRLYNGAEYFLQSGFVIDPDFKVDPVQIKYGRDFLEENTSTDLVIGNFLSDCSRGTGPEEVSPHTWTEDAWYQRIKRGNVKAVINDCGGLIADRFRGQGYRTIISNWYYDSHDPRQLYNEYEYVFQDQYLLLMLNHLNPDSLLVSDIRNDMKAEHWHVGTGSSRGTYDPPLIPSKEHA